MNTDQLPEHDDLWDHVSLVDRQRIEERHNETVGSAFYVGIVIGCVIGVALARYVWPTLFP
jgi:hypothetical protein